MHVDGIQAERDGYEQSAKDYERWADKTANRGDHKEAARLRKEARKYRRWAGLE